MAHGSLLSGQCDQDELKPEKNVECGLRKQDPSVLVLCIPDLHTISADKISPHQKCQAPKVASTDFMHYLCSGIYTYALHIRNFFTQYKNCRLACHPTSKLVSDQFSGYCYIQQNQSNLTWKRSATVKSLYTLKKPATLNQMETKLTHAIAFMCHRIYLD